MLEKIRVIRETTSETIMGPFYYLQNYVIDWLYPHWVSHSVKENEKFTGIQLVGCIYVYT